jgi:hypothetical protein
MHLKPEEVMKRAEKAQGRKDQWRSIFEDCYEFALPQRNLYSGYYDGGSPGQSKMDRVYDSTRRSIRRSALPTAFSPRYFRHIETGAGYMLATISPPIRSATYRWRSIFITSACLRFFARPISTWRCPSSCSI